MICVDLIYNICGHHLGRVLTLFMLIQIVLFFEMALLMLVRLL